MKNNAWLAFVFLSGWLLGVSPCFSTMDEKAMSAGEVPFNSYAGLVISEIRIDGNRVTKDYVIAREILSEVGHELNPVLLQEDLTRLENLSIFGSVDVVVQKTGDEVALDFSFTEIPWIIPYPAIGYTEENGFSLGVGMASPNFRGRDISLSASAVFGGTNTYKIAAENPWIGGNHVSAGMQAYHQSRRNELLEFEQTSDYVQLNTGKYLGENGRLKVYCGYYGVQSGEPDITLDSDNRDNLWFSAATLGYDGRDSWRSPHAGWHNEAGLMYLGGDANSWSIGLDIRRYEPVGDRHTLATGPYLGLQTGKVGENIPSYLQFFVGGANSVRGYKLEELGKEVFGQNQFLYTLEYRYLWKPIRPIKIIKWYFSLGMELAAFGDVGLAWSDPHDFNVDRTRSGYGVGARILIPGLESLRFDIARSEEGDVVFNFGVYTIFDERKKRIR